MLDTAALLDTDLIDINVELFKRRRFDFITVINGDGELQHKHYKQEEALKALTDVSVTECVYGGAAGGAKSWTGCVWIALSCMAYAGSKWFIARENRSSIEQSTLITWRKVCKAYGLIEGRDWDYFSTGHTIRFTCGSEVELIEASFQPKKDPMFERLGSKEYTGGWIEEGGEVHAKAFDVLKSRCGRHLNAEFNLPAKILVTCNPKKNWLYTQFYKASVKGALSRFQRFIQSLVTDNPFIDPGYIENLKQIKDISLKERLLKGNWDYDSDPRAIMEYINITDMFRNDHVVGTGTKYITADIARQGEDYTRIYLWDGMVNIRRVSLAKSKVDETAAQIKKMANEYGIPMSRIVVDEDGVGGGVKDILRCQGVVNNSTPFPNLKGEKENARNKRSQLYIKLGKLVMAGQIAVRDCDPEEQDEIATELSVIKRKSLDSDGPEEIISREEIKELIGVSPDHATCFMLRMFFEYQIVRPARFTF